MIGPVGHDAGMPRGGPDRTDGPGKKMQAAGQKAKMAVTAGKESGIELPKNAQGMAASGLARGADPESLFASLVSDPVDPVTDPDHVTDPVIPDPDVTDESGGEGPVIAVDEVSLNSDET